jgi:peptide/nickel transport system ATP-binding protein
MNAPLVEVRGLARTLVEVRGLARTLVEVRGLARTFDVSKPWLQRVVERSPRRHLKAVQEVSFAVVRGETFALVGESGSGKSTIARMVVGLLPATRGSVVVMGTDIADRRRAAEIRSIRNRIQMIFQDPFASLNPRWRVADLIAEPILAFKLAATPAAVEAKVAQLLRQVGLDPRDGARFPHQFSGGQRQRICIARALASAPEFLVCDEPTSALDVSVQAQILNLMRDLQDELALTYLLISHNLAVVRHMATRIGVLYLGRLVEVAPAKTLFRRPLHPYTRMLLDAVPDLSMSGRPRRPVTGEIPSPIDPPPGCAFHPRCPLAFDRCRAEIPLPLPQADALVACHAVEEGRVG